MSIDISEISVITATENQAYSDLDGEAVIFHLESGTYYGLNKTGASIWQLIQEGSKPVNELRNALLEKYEVEPEQCNSDLLALLQELSMFGLIEVRNGAIV